MFQTSLPPPFLTSLATLPWLGGCLQPASAPLESPSGLRPPEPEPWQPPGTRDLDAFASSVQTTDAASSGVLVSCHTSEERVSYLLVKQSGTTWVEVESSEPLSANDGVVQLELDNLDADTAYSLAVYATDGERPRRSRSFSHRPCPRRAARRHPRRDDLGSSNPSGAACCMRRPSAGCVLAAGRHRVRRWIPQRRGLPVALAQGLTHRVSKLSESTSFVATWDDHELDNDWSWESDANASSYPNALQVFREALPQRPCPAAATSGASCLGATPSTCSCWTAGERRDGRYLSEEQTTWLLDGSARARPASRSSSTACPSPTCRRCSARATWSQATSGTASSTSAASSSMPSSTRASRA